MEFPDFVPSGNQAAAPEIYEIENRAIDRDGIMWNRLQRLARWRGKTLLDLGCGSGYWLPKYHEAAQVIGVEPDASLIGLARARPGGATVLSGSAEHLPLADASVDVVHARFAYFFPHPGFDPSAGLAEVSRVLRTGGSLIVIDNDTQEGEFAELLRNSPWAEQQGQDTYATDWWQRQGATTHPVMSSWRFNSRAGMESVLRLEFPADVADAWLAAHPERTHLSYGYLLHHWRK